MADAPTTPRQPVTYEVEITGNAAPYKWGLWRKAPSFGRTKVIGAEGEAETVTEAAFDAQERARNEHEAWLHAKTKITMEVYVGPDLENEYAGRPTAAPMDPEQRERFLGGYMD